MAFLAAYRETGNVVHAARAAKVKRTQHYHWLDSDPEYARQFDESRRQAADILESEAIRRAVAGTKEMVFVGGKPFRDPETGDYLYRYKYSDTLLIFLLKGLLPEKYRDSFIPATGDDDGVRIAGRGREAVIEEEIAARQNVLDMLRRNRQGTN
jgi:hypothetical protein